jgi:hypothetical protein
MGVSFKEAKTLIKSNYRENGRRSTRDTLRRKGATILIERNRSQYLDSAQVTID